jgi:hypothetical protein
MGVAIIGFAAYRDDTGRLCTFEYVVLPYQGLLSKANFHTASVPRIPDRLPSLKPTLRRLNISLDNGGDGFHRKVCMLIHIHIFPIYLSRF